MDNVFCVPGGDFVAGAKTQGLYGPVWRELAELWQEALRHCGSAT